jgi:hypothetical protein
MLAILRSTSCRNAVTFVQGEAWVVLKHLDLLSLHLKSRALWVAVEDVYNLRGCYEAGERFLDVIRLHGGVRFGKHLRHDEGNRCVLHQFCCVGKSKVQRQCNLRGVGKDSTDLLLLHVLKLPCGTCQMWCLPPETGQHTFLQRPAQGALNLMIWIVCEQWQALGSVRGDGDQRVAELEDILQSVCGSPVAHVVDPVRGGVVVKAGHGTVLFDVEPRDAIWPSSWSVHPVQN